MVTEVTGKGPVRRIFVYQKPRPNNDSMNALLGRDYFRTRSLILQLYTHDGVGVAVAVDEQLTIAERLGSRSR